MEGKTCRPTLICLDGNLKKGSLQPFQGGIDLDLAVFVSFIQFLTLWGMHFFASCGQIGNLGLGLFVYAAERSIYTYS